MQITWLNVGGFPGCGDNLVGWLEWLVCFVILRAKYAHFFGVAGWLGVCLSASTLGICWQFFLSAFVVGPQNCLRDHNSGLCFFFRFRLVTIVWLASLVNLNNWP